MSVNHSRMKRMPVPRTYSRTSSRVLGWSSVCAMAAQTRGRSVQPSLALRPKLQPAQGPLAQLVQRGCELAAHVGERVLDARRRALPDLPLDDPAGLELLHPLRQQAVGQVRDGTADLREAHRAAMQQHVDDRARPALAD